ncbi:MAG: Peptide deformylase [Microgenomates group bacterium GW2011_GWC1_39_7b]|uniref:Peptide deformylase n=3 Tax=Candidatus Woeseibacteriota TaxID=1752722 RepID=A0A0G0XX29_9BACT|nr:MAG: Peptide deformylase [Candidatus Woesebacteria bacterium GW2011_GWB1_39_10]KKR26685.1 MAG: Peptide deformylase [Microgenomates group bacterium GW2011_GWC1_39_7b]KKR74192.1 MAG: Peptide deformylase [Candidatus Woesebacteria bacterium GW2011_GWA2_40_7]KKR92477.1 MAG: Peptide deformylase [Candidatus Woesebacteria bacterium GW2011_GWA1_41_13b]
MIRKIIQSGNPILRRKSKNIAKVDKKVQEIIRDLKDTLKTQKEPEGVGLAAPQIGKNLNIFIASYKNFQRVVINPEILKISGAKSEKLKVKSKKEILEGCLSLPYYYGPLKRADKITVKYLNEKGEEITEDLEGFDAQIILHEIDHLEGKLFIDRLFEEKKPLYKVDGDEWEEVELS